MASDRTAPSPLEAIQLVTQCLSEDLELRTAARQWFQSVYGTIIYHFPIKIGGLSEEAAGDFYLYVFEHDRLFQRLRTFQGRNNIHFRTFLSYYVLKTLFFEWRRAQRTLATVSLDAPLNETAEEDTRTLHDILPGKTPEPTADASARAALAQRILTTFTPEERLLVKLLALAECELHPADLRLLADLSHRSLEEVLTLITEVRDSLIEKDEKYARLHGELDSTWGWIVLRQQEMQQMHETLHLREQESNTYVQQEMPQPQGTMEAKLTKRLLQRQRLLTELQALKLTTPYKDVARLLGCPVGTLSARLTRLRERVMRDFGEAWQQGGESV